jgi:C1A family cysteine protease
MDIEQRQFGCIPSKPDERDYLACSYLPSGLVQYPESFRLHNLTGKIFDQGNTQKCVAYSVKQILEVLNQYDKDAYIPMSVDYIFSNRYVDQDNSMLLPFEGSYPREIIQSVQRSGACEDSYCPTKQPDNFNDFVNISEDMRTNAEKHKIATYLKITTDEDIKSALINLNAPVLISIPVTNKFIGDYNEQITWEYAKSNLRGYHAIVIVGWHKYNGIEYWDVINSWGTSWGNYEGFTFLPFGYPIQEAWSVTDIPLKHWCTKYYDYLNQNNIPVEEKGFDIQATRGYVFKLIARFKGYKEDLDMSDTEVSVGGVHWAYKYWDYCNKNGVTIYDTRFDDKITRGEVITLIARIKGFIEPIK